MIDSDTMGSRQTRDIEPLLDQYWASVVDGGPTLNQQWLNVSCLVGCPQQKSAGCHFSTLGRNF